MKRLILAIAFVLGWASAAWAAAPAQLTTLHAIHSLSRDEVGKNLPVAFEATVTYLRQGKTSLFVQDGNEGLLVKTNTNLKLAPGDHILIEGKAQFSFRPIVIAENITVLDHVTLPKPVPATFDELNRSERDCLRVTVRAVVRTTDVRFNSGRPATQIHLLIDGGTLDVWVDGDDPIPFQELIDATVEVIGVAS